MCVHPQASVEEDDFRAIKLKNVLELLLSKYTPSKEDNLRRSDPKVVISHY